jgi:hypothetical protein
MAVIRVPKTPKTAFDRDRTPSDLLLKQIEHLEWALLPAAQRTPRLLPKKKVTTEAQAAERVGQLTTLLLGAKAAAASAQGALPAAPVVLPPIPRPPTGQPAAARASRRAATAGGGEKAKATRPAKAPRAPRAAAGARRRRRGRS